MGDTEDAVAPAALEALITVLLAPLVIVERLLPAPGLSGGLSTPRLLLCGLGWELAFRAFRWATKSLFILGSDGARVLLGAGQLPGEDAEGLQRELRALTLPLLKSRALKSGLDEAAIRRAFDGAVAPTRIHRHLVSLVLEAERRRAELRTLDVLYEQGPSYFVSMLHATIVGVRGVFHATALLNAPPTVKIVMAAARDTEWAATLDAIEQTNHLFLSYLLFDMLHMVAAFPKLGGFDMIAHHTVFIICSAVCGSLCALPFPFAWLILGELSTIWLGVRWFLIKTGRGADRSMDITNGLFAVTFLGTRIVVYAAGLLQLLHIVFFSSMPEGGTVLDTLTQCSRQELHVEEGEHEANEFQTEARGNADAPWIGCETAQRMIYGVAALLVAGQGLNLVWGAKIVRMATKGAAAKTQLEDEEDETTDHSGGDEAGAETKKTA